MKFKTKAEEDTTLFTIISKLAPIGASNVKRLIKAKEAKINGVRVGENAQIHSGDEVEIFVPEKFLGEQPTIIYEDANILIVDKPALTEVDPTLLNALKDNREFIKPLHRLDRNTIGLVVFALNENAYNELYDAFKIRSIEKRYKAVVLGNSLKTGTYSAYIFKDSAKSISYVSSVKKEGYKKIVTVITEVVEHDGISYVDIELVTGRTHQIRAHLAYLGHPVLGDNRYGNSEVNGKYKLSRQQLCAYKLVFHKLNGEMSYLNEKVFLSKQNLLTSSEI